MTDHALKLALKSKMKCDKRIFTTLRYKVIRELRKAKATFINETRGNTKEIWQNEIDFQMVINCIEQQN